MKTIGAERTTVRLTEENRKKIEEHMRKNGSTVSRLTNIALERFFEAERAEQKPLCP